MTTEIDTASGRLTVRDTPADAPDGAPALVLVHGFGTSGRLWDATAAALGGQVRCVAPDLPGWGGSERTGDYGVDAQARAVGRVVAALGIERWALAGHSMGGKIALALAAARPPGLTALVLVAPSPPTPEPMTDDARQRLRDAWGDRAAVEALMPGLSSAAATGARPADVARTIEDHLRASRGAWTAWLDAGSREDLAPLASGIAVPTCVVAAADDDALGPDVQRRETVARIADARLVVVDGSRHLVPLDAPEALARLLVSVAGV